jgi:predicted CXXCH cytochrome family protein
MPFTHPHLLAQVIVVLAGLLVMVILLLRGQRWARSLQALFAITLITAITLVASTRGSRIADSAASFSQLMSSIPRAGLRDAGFVTSNSCRSCHPREYDTWHGSYHRTMTQPAIPSAVIAPLSNLRLFNRGREYFIWRDADEYWIDMVDSDWEHDLLARGQSPDGVPNPPRVRTRIVMTTGSHHQQTYWVASATRGVLYNVPFMYLVEDQRLVPREDVFLRPPDAGRGHDVWNNNCIECHSVAGEGNFDQSGMAHSEVAELGISCEACHGPGYKHLQANRDPIRRLALHRSDQSDDTIVQPARLTAQAAAHVCGQCHGMNVFKNDVLRTGERFRAGGDLTRTKMILRTCDRKTTDLDKPDWPRLLKHLQRQSPTFLEERFWSDGMVRVSGREHNAMVESACFDTRKLSCLSCHSMHSSDATDQLAHGMATNEACLQCHREYRAPERVAAHTHHPTGSSGSECLNCHMPHTTYGLLKAIRSHLIDSPSVRSTLDTGRPNACNLCHLDQPLSFAARHLHEWYGQESPSLPLEHQTVSAALLWALRGDANQRALIAWHMGWKPAVKTSGEEWLGAPLAHLLADPYSAVRYIAARSLKKQPSFHDFVYDFVAPSQQLKEARDRAMEHWQMTRPPTLDRTGPAVLIEYGRRLHNSMFDQYAQQRDDRRVDLRE